MTRKTFVIDTNVLLHDPEALIQFPSNDVVISMAVLEELEPLHNDFNHILDSDAVLLTVLDRAVLPHDTENIACFVACCIAGAACRIAVGVEVKPIVEYEWLTHSATSRSSLSVFPSVSTASITPANTLPSSCSCRAFKIPHAM